MPRVLALIALLAVLLAAPPAAATMYGGAIGLQPGPAQEEFVPVDDVPAEDRLPAAPMVIAAYLIVWAGLLWYVWWVWRRLAAVERDMRALATRIKSST